MGKLAKMSYLLMMLGIAAAVSGCGDTSTNPSATVPIAASLNSDGTATTGAGITTVATDPNTPGYLAAVSATLLPGTTITAKNADGSTKPLTATPSFTFTAPADSSATFAGTISVPVPTGFKSLQSVSGAVDVQLTGSDSAAFNPPITITMPVPGEPVGSVIAVYTVTGATYTLLGNYTVATAGFVSFPVSSLSWKVANPITDSGTPTTIATTVPGTGTTIPGTTVATTVPGTGTTIPATTVATTVPGTTVGTTIPATTVATTVPATTVATTIPSTTVATTIPSTTVATTVATTTTTAPTTTVATTIATTTTVAPDGAALYAATCQGCHGPLAAPTRPIRARTVAGIRAAGMAWGLTDAQLTAIIAVLP